MEPLWDLVRAIPRGRCTSYGALGRALPNPVSGYLVGRWMAQAPEGVPWWRVVAKDGALPVHKRDPRIADQQAARLAAEGVSVADGKVLDMEAVYWEP